MIIMCINEFLPFAPHLSILTFLHNFKQYSGADLALEKGVVQICFIEGKATE